MTVHAIRIAGDPVLHNPTREITEFDDQLHTLVDDMFETMYAAEGVGLAANQIGLDLRLFVYDCPDDEGVRHKGVVVNPKLETSEIPETMPDPDGYFARCLQHETDHLDGYIYLDRLVGRHARAAKKMLKSNKWGVPGLSWLPPRTPEDDGAVI